MRKPRDKLPEQALLEERCKKFKSLSLPKGKNICEVLSKHHEVLNDDPEHLSTDFIKNILNINKECTPGNKIKREPMSEATKTKISLSNMGKVVSDETREKISGERSGLWKGGVSFEPYCPKFNNEFKERVRAFFGYQCVECGTPQNGKKLHVHHVNFRKDSCCAEDVIPLFVSLCPSCHSKTNTNRVFWEWWFTEMIDYLYEGRCYLPKEFV